MGKSKKKELAIYESPYVQLPYMMMKSAEFRSLPGNAFKLYCYMRMAVLDPDGSRNNHNPLRVLFGPSDVRWMHKTQYYKSLGILLELGIVDELEGGGHGKKGAYDLTYLGWMG